MREIDIYIERLYKNTSSKDGSYLKEEMKSHLLQSVKELKSEGFSEEESVRLAIERFGELDEVKGEIETVVTKKSGFYIASVVLSLISVLYIGLILISMFKHSNYSIDRALILMFPINIGYIALRLYILSKKKDIKSIKVRNEFFAFLTVLLSSYLFLGFINSINLYANYEIEVNLVPFSAFIEGMSNRNETGLPLIPMILHRVKQIILYLALGFIAPQGFEAFKKKKNIVILGGFIIITPLIMFFIFKLVGVTILTHLRFGFFDELIYMLIGSTVGYYSYKKII